MPEWKKAQKNTKKNMIYGAINKTTTNCKPCETGPECCFLNVAALNNCLICSEFRNLVRLKKVNF